MADPVSGARSEMQSIWTRALLGVQPTWGRDFDDLSNEWRRLFAEVLGTFLLVLAAAGGPAVAAYGHGAVSRVAYVSAPGLMVMAVILSIGLISGAHQNGAVTLAFALRHEFPWRRVPGYLMAQVVGSVLACLLLWALVGRVGLLGATEPGRGVSDLQAMVMEAALTFGLVTVILGTASGAQNVEPLSLGSGGLRRAGRPLVQPHQWSVDEPGPVPRSRSRHGGLLPLLGIPGRARARRSTGSGGSSRSAGQRGRRGG